MQRQRETGFTAAYLFDGGITVDLTAVDGCRKAETCILFQHGQLRTACGGVSQDLCGNRCFLCNFATESILFRSFMSSTGLIAAVYCPAPHSSAFDITASKSSFNVRSVPLMIQIELSFAEIQFLCDIRILLV